MITKIINRLVRTVRNSAYATELRYRLRFPGVAIHTTVNMDVKGQFDCNDGCINSWSQIIVPPGATLALGDGCFIGRNVELGPTGTIRIGRLTSIQDRCIVLGNVQIGEYCVFAPNIYISSGLHHFDSQPWALIKDQDEQAAARQDLAGKSAGQVVIEDDCWIGINVVVMRGVRVCKGAVIGANSVVTKDVSPYTVVAGAPASELRKRLNFRPPQAIQWDSDEDMPYFYSGFEISRVERARNKNLGGLAVRHAVFRIALACIEEAKIVVLAKLSQQGRPAQLRSGGVTHALSDEFRELAFPVVGKAQLHELEVHGLPRGDEARLIVKSAWLETD